MLRCVIVDIYFVFEIPLAFACIVFVCMVVRFVVVSESFMLCVQFGVGSVLLSFETGERPPAPTMTKFVSD